MFQSKLYFESMNGHCVFIITNQMWYFFCGELDLTVLIELRFLKKEQDTACKDAIYLRMLALDICQQTFLALGFPAWFAAH